MHRSRMMSSSVENQKETLANGPAGCRRRRIVLFPLPFQGHINPVLQLAGILHSRGFSVDIIHTRYNSPPTSNYPHFIFHPIDDGLSESQISSTASINLLPVLFANCFSPFRACLDKLLLDSAAAGEPVACLITDAWWHFSQSVADSFGLPRIVLRTSSVAATLGFSALLLLQENGGLQELKPEEDVPDLPPLKIKDLPTIKVLNSKDLCRLVEPMIDKIKASSGIIWNSFEELEPSAMTKSLQDFPVPSFPIGPFHKYFPASSRGLLAQDASCISWLDTQAPKSVLYVSFGSLATMEEQEFLEMAFGLESSIQPFLLAIRPGLVPGSEWPGPLPRGFMARVGGRGHVVKWSPQQEVLAHPAIGGFWTHCGWNSTLESICEGVPVICSPFFVDQMANARYVRDVWRIGLVLEKGAERGEVEKTIRRLMVEKEGEKMRQKALQLKEKVELCLRQGGSSYHRLESLVNYILSF